MSSTTAKCSLLRGILTTSVLLGTLAWTPTSWAQVWVPGKGHGQIWVNFQQIKVSQRANSSGVTEEFGDITDRGLYLNLDYGLTDRWAVTAVLPYGSNRYQGNRPHDPRIFFPNLHGQRLIDDGNFHGGWADWAVGLRYQWPTKWLLVTPFISYSQPSHDYVFFAHSQLGTHQWRLQVGASVTRPIAPPWQNLYWQARYAYSYMEPKYNRRVNHAVLALELGYRINPSLSAHLQVEQQWSYNGLDGPQGFRNADGSLNRDLFLYHEALAGVENAKASVGVGYQLNNHYVLFADYGKTLREKNTDRIDSAINFGISRSF